MSTEWVFTAGAFAAMLPFLRQRLQLSRAKHRSLAGHSRMAKRLTRWLPGYSLDESRFFEADGAPASVVAQRRAGFYRLSETLKAMAPRGLELTAQARASLPDLQFTGRYRVPFQFSDMVGQHLPLPAFWAEAAGVGLTDLDGNRYLDLTGSYGVNVFGVDFYKQTMAEGATLGSSLGPVLGGYHPCVADNVERLKALTGMDAVSFHMSGTEAVMQAVRLARYHSGRKKLVRFCGAYHGWWDDVQPGPGNPMPPGHVFTLKDMDDRCLQVLRSRRDIACVLVNPLQALHPNANAPGDSTLVADRVSVPVSREAYSAWLKRLREVCTERGIALIFDEVFVGFRLARGGAQEYFGVAADMVTYGKTLAGGMPVGVVCGRDGWMQRYRADRPADICFARGTFNAHPYVMGAMNAFLRRLEQDDVRAVYEGLDQRWSSRLARFNAGLQREELPVAVVGLSSIWSVNLTRPSRYHWMLQFYLREQGLALSWVGTGRLVFTLMHSDDDMDDILRRFIRACNQMRSDGWWNLPEGATGKDLRRQLLKEMWRSR